MRLPLDLEEGNVDDRGVEVDALEKEHLEGEAPLKLGLGARMLVVDQPQGNILVHLYVYNIS